MFKKRIRLPKHLGVQIMHEVGKLDNGIEFIDMNKSIHNNQSNFSSMILRCIETDKRINSFLKISDEMEIKQKKFGEFDEYKVYSNYFLNKMDILTKLPFDYIEAEVQKDESNIKEMYYNYLEITDHISTLKEKREVWNKLNKLMIEKNSSGNMIGSNIG